MSHKLTFLAIFACLISSGLAFGQGVQVEPGMVGGGTRPGTPNPPNNPSQAASPSAPGVIITYPPSQPPTRVKCIRDGKEVPC